MDQNLITFLTFSCSPMIMQTTRQKRGGGTMPFEKYLGQRPRGTKPIVSIRKNGQIAFNAIAVETFSIEKYRFADLYYDRAARKVCIQLTKIKSKGSRKLTSLYGGVVVSGSAFLRHFGVTIKKARKFDPKFDKAKGMIILQL